MVYKKYVYKRGRRHGPYYYHSYRDGDAVKKVYIGGEKEYKSWLEKQRGEISKKYVEQPSYFKKHSKRIGKFVFIFSLAILIFIALFGFAGIINNMNSPAVGISIIGYVLAENFSENLNVPHSGYGGGVVVEKFDTEKIDLEIEEPPKLSGETLTKNKNKRMDFQFQGGNLRVYFDLLNYSEFVESLTNKTLETPIETGIAQPESALIEEINQTESNATNLENIAENETNVFETNEIINESQEAEQIEENMTGEPSVTGSIIKNLFRITARIIGIDVNETLSEEAVENVSESKKLEKIKEKAVIEAEDFDIVVNAEKSKIEKSEENPEYKWGYKVKLKDLKFMAKIDITSDKEISVWDEDTLKIENNLLSFSDLTKQGYKVRIEKPALEMGIYNLSVSNISEIEENATIPEEVNVTLPENATIPEEVNVTLPENATETEEANATESSLEQPVEQPAAEPPITEPENAEQPAEQAVAPIEEIIQEETISEPEITEETEQPTESEEQTGITGSIIKNLFKITARIIGIDINETQGIEDLKYKNTLTVYIERDFASISRENSTELDNLQYEDIDNSGDISVGDIIELDPTLKTIEIIKAEHLNENRSFISDIYDYVKEKDENWSETIYNNEYVRVTFIQNLTKDKDITIYARAKNTTECYDNETEILTLNEDGEEEWKLFKDLNYDEEVMTLNQEIGEKEWQIPLERQEFEHDKEMYKVILEDGSDLVVSEEHKVYAGEGLEGRGSTVNLSSYNVMNLPSKLSEDFSLINLENSFNNNSELSCGILNQTIENIVSLLYENLSVKSQSLVTNILCSDLENSANLPLSSCLGLKITSKSFLRNCNSSFLTFSSSRNLSSWSFDANDDIISSLNKTSCILQSCFNMLFCERHKECIKNFFYWNSSFEQLKNLPNHDSCAFESGLSMADIAVCNNIFVNFNFHCNDINNNDYLSFSIEKNPSNFKLQLITETYEDINNGKEVYFLDSENNPIKVKSITKQEYNGKIYDVDVENDIVLVRRKNSPALWSGNSNPENEIASIEVYVKDNNTLITKFENITEENWHKVYLTNLTENESYDVFDLKILGEVEFDYIVDPTITQGQAVTDSLLTDVVAETGQMNFTHLNVSNTAPYDSLVGYWSFDGDKEDTTGFTAYDFTKYNYNSAGQANAHVNSSGCIYDNCLQLDGYDDFLFNSSFAPGDTNGITVTFWMNGRAFDNSDGLFTTSSASPLIFVGSSGATATVRMFADNSTNSWVCDTYASSSLGNRINTWVFVTALLNTTGCYIYYNATLIASDTTISTPWQGPSNIYIGSDRSLDGRSFNGSIDEMMYFNTSLTAAQISAIYNNQSSRFKATGKQEFKNQSILNITSGNNRVNVTTDFEAKLGSQLNLSVGYYDGSWSYTAPQTLTAGAVHTFNTSSTTTNLTLNYTFIAGNSTNPFYSPILNGSIVFDVWNVAAATDTIPPNINFTNPTPSNGSSQANTNIFVNVTA
ncbi:MAG: LamG-like jellyroll fold domain-containing protein, partial [Nanoarchaeota archaeon]|nr:LamG-like jellyroll fold domain-containing protein [Nanoarchaeota archaeon]